MSDRDTQDAILVHLREVAHVKRAMLQTALKIADDYPTDGVVLLKAIKSLTASADRLLGDTAVTGPPEG